MNLMIMEINLKGKINNTKLKPANCLSPLFEAVINSIEAIREAKKDKEGSIKITAVRDDSQIMIESNEKDKSDNFKSYPIISFIVEDNGIGFTDNNFQSFQTSDSTYKQGIGGKGVGRFLWLKAFSNISINSYYFEKTTPYHRKFQFNIDKGINSEEMVEMKEGLNSNKTIIELKNYKKKYSEKCPKRIDTIANKIVEHCLSYLVLENCPKIFITDNIEDININDSFKQIFKVMPEKEAFKIDKYTFDIKHCFCYSNYAEDNRLHYCANNREVKNERLDKYLPVSTLEDENDRKFYYSAYIMGKYLDENVNNERTNFVIPDESDFINEITEQQIRDEAVKGIRKYLSYNLEKAEKSFVERIKKIILCGFPQYRPLLKHKLNDLKNINYNIKDENLDIELYKIKQNLELETREEGKKLSTIKDIKDMDEYKKKYQEYLDKVKGITMSSLAEYIIHRKLILDLLDNNLGFADGKNRFKLESDIHSLIFPLKKTSDDIDYEDMNLWIIDEKLSYHRYLASDIEFKEMDVLDSNKQQRPDIMIFDKPFAFVERETPYPSVVIIEFKRPGRNDYNNEDNPIDQINNYIREIKSQRKKDKNGRPIIYNENTPFYCYIICDLTPKINTYAEDRGFVKTPDNMGYYSYNPNHKAYTEIISFDKLIGDAKKRNRILIDKLLPGNNYSKFP